MLHRRPSDVRAYLNVRVSPASYINPCFLELMRRSRYALTPDEGQHGVSSEGGYNHGRSEHLRFDVGCNATLDSRESSRPWPIVSAATKTFRRAFIAAGKALQADGSEVEFTDGSQGRHGWGTLRNFKGKRLGSGFSPSGRGDHYNRVRTWEDRAGISVLTGL